MKKAKKNKDLEFWVALHEVLQDACDSLPGFSEPDRVYWNHPDDDWKNEAELQNLEEHCAPDTDALILNFCIKQEWPNKSKNNALYFADQRIRWALTFVRFFYHSVSGNRGCSHTTSRSKRMGLITMVTHHCVSSKISSNPEKPILHVRPRWQGY